MREEHSFSGDFIVRVGRNVKEKANVFARITVGGIIREISIKQKVDLNEGDSKKEVEAGTMKNYRTTAEYPEQFLKQELKRDDISPIELDYQFLTNVEYFIRHRPIKKHNPCEGNGVYKHLERIKKMVHWAKKLGWLSSNPFEDYELKFKKTKRKKLHIDELINIENQSFGNSKLEFVKDLFVFSYYTGLAYADVIKLSE